MGLAVAQLFDENFTVVLAQLRSRTLDPSRSAGKFPDHVLHADLAQLPIFNTNDAFTCFYLLVFKDHRHIVDRRDGCANFFGATQQGIKRNLADFRLQLCVQRLVVVQARTVIGFYLLLTMGPNGYFGQFTQWLGLGTLTFSFAGLVIGSVIYSMPFVVQPLQNAFSAIGTRPLEVAATLRANPWDTFFTVILPLARPGFITASILGFAHTVGEFGVVLMIGGNIPNKTRVVSVQIYDHVEAMEYAQAHWLAGSMVVFSFLVLLALYSSRKTKAGWS